jgi:hypothetical protein
MRIEEGFRWLVPLNAMCFRSRNCPSSPPPVAASAPAPAAPRPLLRVSAVAQEGGCVDIDGGACGSSASSIGSEGTRGFVVASANPGHQFLGWASSSPDCPGERRTLCSFAYDRSKTITAIFGN